MTEQERLKVDMEKAAAVRTAYDMGRKSGYKLGYCEGKIAGLVFCDELMKKNLNRVNKILEVAK